MSRNGSGVYTPPTASYPAISGTLIEAAKFNAVIDDVSTAISESVAINGQTTMTGDLPMGTHKVTGMANGVAATDAMAYGQASGLFSLFDGTTTNDDAAAGKVGEYLTSSLDSLSAVTLSNGIAKTVVSRELTAGDWEVEGLIVYDATVAITSLAAVRGSLSSTTNTEGSRKSSKVYIGTAASFDSSTAGAIHEVTPTTRFSLAATATVYLVAFSYFTVGAGTLKAYGDIAARRAR